MNNEKFLMSEDLLRSVILKQAGSINKAIQECIQNALDADAKTINITINERGFTFSDNGCGMNKKEINTFFKIFGNSSKKDDKDKIGAFGMGRGQVFSFGFTLWETKEWRITVDIMKKLGYKIRKVKNNVKGTKITCVFYKKIPSWDLRDYIYKIKNYYLPNKNIRVFINGTEYKPDIEIDEKYSNEMFTVFNSCDFNRYIFSQGIHIQGVSNTIFDYNINCNVKMDLNFARNSFLETDEKTRKLYELISRIEKSKLLETKKFNKTSGEHVLRLLVKGKLDIKDFKGKKVVETANGKLLSLGNLEKHKEIIFGEKNLVSDKAIQQGYTVINKRFKMYLVELSNMGCFKGNISKRIPSDVVIYSNMEIVDRSELFLLVGYRGLLYHLYAKEMNRVVFGGERKINIGRSDLANGWTDGKTYIAINLKLYNKKEKRRVKDMLLYELLLHEYAHDDDDTDETSHDGNFYERFYDLMNSTKKKFGKFISQNGIKEIERKFGLEIQKIIDEAEKKKEEIKNNKKNNRKNNRR